MVGVDGRIGWVQLSVTALIFPARILPTPPPYCPGVLKPSDLNLSAMCTISGLVTVSSLPCAGQPGFQARSPDRTGTVARRVVDTQCGDRWVPPSGCLSYSTWEEMIRAGLP